MSSTHPSPTRNADEIAEGLHLAAVSAAGHIKHQFELPREVIDDIDFLLDRAEEQPGAYALGLREARNLVYRATDLCEEENTISARFTLAAALLLANAAMRGEETPLLSGWENL